MGYVVLVRLLSTICWLIVGNTALGATIMNTELVVDGSAENGLTGWTINTGSPVAALYASDTTPNPNPAVCGTHEFRADGTYTKMSQVISLTSAPTAELTDIDMSTVTVTYSCYVGGWEDQTDHAVVTFQPTTALSATTGAATTFTATPADRGDVTKMVFRTASMALPATTRSFTVTYECFRDAGNYCDGYVDVVSIKLTVPSCSCGTVCPSGGSCPAGSYCAASTGYYQGVVCNAGDYCASGSCTAANCPAGSYCSTPSVVAACSSRLRPRTVQLETTAALPRRLRAARLVATAPRGRRPRLTVPLGRTARRLLTKWRAAAGATARCDQQQRRTALLGATAALHRLRSLVPMGATAPRDQQLTLTVQLGVTAARRPPRFCALPASTVRGVLLPP